MTYRVAAFYQFAALPDFRALREPLRALCASLDLKGSVLLAPRVRFLFQPHTAPAIEAYTNARLVEAGASR